MFGGEKSLTHTGIPTPDRAARRLVSIPVELSWLFLATQWEVETGRKRKKNFEILESQGGDCEKAYTISWDMKARSLVQIYRRVVRTYCLHDQEQKYRRRRKNSS
jgi:hypothetical protein